METPDLTALKERTGAKDLPGFLTVAEEALAKASSGDGGAKELLWEWLEAARDEAVLRGLGDSGLGDRWFELVLDAMRILELDFGELFRRRVRRYGDRALLITFEGEEVRQHSWTDVARRADDIARGLLAIGEGSAPVAFFVPNSLDGAVCDLACLTRGIVNAVIPGTATAEHIEDILSRTQARIAVVGDEKGYARLTGAGKPGKALKHVVVLDAAKCPADPRLLSLAALERRGREAADEPAVWPERGLDDLATVMFTSGSTGLPKGICFSHRMIVSKRYARSLALPYVGEDNVFVSFLPLYHTFGRWLELTGTIFWGGRYAFASNPSIHAILDNMRRVKATGFISVPLKWLQLREELAKGVDLETASTEDIKKELARLTGGGLCWGLSAAGYLDPEAFSLFQLLGVDLMSGFGMTEATGGITMTPPGAYKAGTVGKRLPGVELKCAEDGELLIRGPYIMESYFTDGGTRPASEDGWFRTGDIFREDRDGYLSILDRKKDIYKNLRGETIAPQRIENLFAELSGIQRAFLVGDRRAYNTLLLVPDFEHAGTDLKKLSPDELKEFFRPDVVAVNRFLSPHERIVDFCVWEEGFSVEAGELTAKGTYKRWKIEERCKDVIEPMYRRRHVELPVGTFTVRVPHWFLRARGMTEASVTAEDSSVRLEDGSRLPLKPGGSSDEVLVGSLAYRCERRVLDLDFWLRSAALWAGNADLVAFAGPEIATWRATGGSPGIELLGDPGREPELEDLPLPDPAVEGPVDSLMNLHRAACLLAHPNAGKASALSAVKHLGKVLLEATYEYAALSRQRLAWAAYHPDFEVRASAYQTLLRGEGGAGTKSYFQAFLDSGLPFLDAEVIEDICGSRLDDEQLTALRSRLEHYRGALDWPLSRTATEQFSHIITLLGNYGTSHRDSYASLRGELANWQQFPGSPALRREAYEALSELTKSFRSWLAGETQASKSSGRVNLDEIVEFELGIDLIEQQRIREALANTPMLAETVFVLYAGKRLKDSDLVPNGVWISLIGSRFGSSIYHVAVETKAAELFEFRLALNRTRSPEEFCADEYLRMAACDLPDRPPSIARGGSLWPERGIATRESIAGETLLVMWLRIAGRRSDEIDEASRWECRHHLRLALAAYVDFWKNTHEAWMLTAPTPREVIISRGEVTRGVRLANITGRAPFTRELDIIVALHQGFYRALSHNCPRLRDCLTPELMFEAVLEALGEKRGREVLSACRRQAEDREISNPQLRELCEKSAEFDREIEKDGFRPLPLRAAVQRYRRWSKLNPGSTPEARLRTVLGVYRWHKLDDIEDRYPEVRVRLFRETFWADAPAPLAEALDLAIQKLRGAADPQQQILRRVSELRMDVRLGKEDDAYMTWLTYPHLEPTQKPKLVTADLSEKPGVHLSTTISDSKGAQYEIRPAGSPREVARLTRLFRFSKLPVKINPRHEALVVLDERKNIVAGWLYWMLEPTHAFVHGVVIAPSFRGRGLSRAMVADFLGRLRSHGVRLLTVDYVLPDFWMKMGFKASPDYGGLTKEIDED